MSEEKEAFRRREHLSLPPGYEEATSSRNSDAGDDDDNSNRESSHLLGSSNNNNDNTIDDGPFVPPQSWRAQRRQQQQQQRHPDGYQAPTVESVRSSFDSSADQTHRLRSGRSSDDVRGLRTEMQQMDIEEPRHQASTRIRQSLSKRLHIIGGAISSLKSSVGSRFGWLTSRIPDVSIPGFTENKIIALQRFFAFFVVMLLLYAIFVSDLFTFRDNTSGASYDPEHVKKYLMDHVDTSKIKESMQYLTSFDKLAGTEGDFVILSLTFIDNCMKLGRELTIPQVMAQYVARKFKEAGINVETKEYEVYLNYPLEHGRRVAIVEPTSLAWEAKLEESDKNTNPSYKQTSVFHGHSKSGNVTGPLIYANYGSTMDFARLSSLKINVTGAVVLVRYGGLDPGSKVRAAEQAGAVGCIMYSDPSDNSFLNTKDWPEKSQSPDDAVERDSVSFGSIMAGDILTPGKPATADATRIKPAESDILPKIPSLPLSMRDARPLLKALTGHGQKMEKSWRGSVPDVEWWTGGSDSPKVNLVNMQVEHQKQKIWNIMGTIEGYEQSNKKVFIGNHRDAWCYGAADPMSGTAIMLEIARVYGELLQKGWQPMRTIVFGSWDGGEYNMIGSTEYVEEYLQILRDDAVAYINVDAGVYGKTFTAKGSPALKGALLKTLGRVQDPATNKTMRETWGNQSLPGLAGDSDYVAFQNVAGTASIDISFQSDVLPEHSCYDNLKWIETFADPKFEYHTLLAQIWGVLTLEMADEYILSLNYADFAEAIEGYAKDVEQQAMFRAGSSADYAAKNVDFKPLKDQIATLKGKAQNFDKFKQEWESIILSNDNMEGKLLEIRRFSHNTRLADFETYLLDNVGLPGRKFYKYPISAPKLWNSKEVSYFPGLQDALDNNDWPLLKDQIERARSHIDIAMRKAFE